MDYPIFKRKIYSKLVTYEIDFLISRQDKICPIEVKSSGYKYHKAIDEFQKKFSSRILQHYLLYTKDIRKEQDISVFLFIWQVYCNRGRLLKKSLNLLLTASNRDRFFRKMDTWNWQDIPYYM